MQPSSTVGITNGQVADCPLFLVHLLGLLVDGVRLDDHLPRDVALLVELITKLFLFIAVMKWMLIVTPSGMMLPFGPYCGKNRLYFLKKMIGPLKGRCNDQGVANNIGLAGLLAQHCSFNDATFSLLADGGYRAEEQVIIPYR